MYPDGLFEPDHRDQLFVRVAYAVLRLTPRMPAAASTEIKDIARPWPINGIGLAGRIRGGLAGQGARIGQYGG